MVTKKSAKKTVRKSTVKSRRKTVAKKTVVKKTTSHKIPKRTVHCVTVCGPDGCVKICFTKHGAVTGDGKPCHICYHGHFCDKDYVCLSCGTERGFVHAPYKGE